MYWADYSERNINVNLFMKYFVGAEIQKCKKVLNYIDTFLLNVLWSAVHSKERILWMKNHKSLWKVFMTIEFCYIDKFKELLFNASH